MLNNANHAVSESQESKAPRQGSHAAQDVLNLLMLYHSDLQFVMGVVVHVRLAEWMDFQPAPKSPQLNIQ